ncbi:MAG: type II toxin-antitoxin system VapC family toxin [Treponema sp.]|jgi:predicted nucleic acid-binding protein|nr:type II toxin-antitoxin system VapC family toxin [Treponema sp.]
MIYVFDSSFVGAQIIPDEKDPEVDRLCKKIKDNDEKQVPQLLWYEISNIFRNLTLRKRYTFDEVLQFFPLLVAIRLTTDFEAGAAHSEKLLRLCNDYNLSAYDAAYLELAGRKKAVLCTLDENLMKAAEKYGVVTLK